MQNTISFRPAKRYLIKLYLKSIASGAFTIGFGLFGAYHLGLLYPNPSLALLIIAIAVQAIIIVIATLFYLTIHYEIRSDEIIVRSGILTRTVKHVPFRTITNITTTRDIIDQIIGVGSLSIQTAGSGSVIPEEKLAGVTDLSELYEFVARELRRFRTAMNPDQSSTDTVPPANDRVLIAILQELRALRTELRQS